MEGEAIFLNTRGQNGDVRPGQHVLPPLPYEYDALEPYISERTMRLHHDIHHRENVENLNRAEVAVARARRNRDWTALTHWERKLAFDGSGHFLHSIFWTNMSPNGGGRPTDEMLCSMIDRDFGSFDGFRAHFTEAANQTEGGGWALLVWQPIGDKLEILQTDNHELFTQWTTIPILVLDVWEHAYYLQYQTRRGDYIESWWNVVNWIDVARRLAGARRAFVPSGAPGHKDTGDSAETPGDRRPIGGEDSAPTENGRNGAAERDGARERDGAARRGGAGEQGDSQQRDGSYDRGDGAQAPDSSHDGPSGAEGRNGADDTEHTNGAEGPKGSDDADGTGESNGTGGTGGPEEPNGAEEENGAKQPKGSGDTDGAQYGDTTNRPPDGADAGWTDAEPPDTHAPHRDPTEPQIAIDNGAETIDDGDAVVRTVYGTKMTIRRAVRSGAVRGGTPTRSGTVRYVYGRRSSL